MPKGISQWIALAVVMGAVVSDAGALAAQQTRSAAAAAPSKPARRHQRLAVDAVLPPEQNAGVIPRAELQAVLASGIARFLQQVRTEPSMTRGRFVGWRVLALFPRRNDIQVRGVRPGDTITRVNGLPIERPEQFLKVWQSLSTASELIVDIERNGQTSRLRYTIS
jgi:type II secretory pathway component PulC